MKQVSDQSVFPSTSVYTDVAVGAAVEFYTQVVEAWVGCAVSAGGLQGTDTAGPSLFCPEREAPFLKCHLPQACQGGYTWTTNPAVTIGLGSLSSFSQPRVSAHRQKAAPYGRLSLSVCTARSERSNTG
ncbi:hypothetical protein DPX16_17770 [Anabarilius grahami]|uniref:Uncharacterized protein n=1 Tax=Anabarilius grahami TaxID=495550 RepID=A0A3N0YHR6_ANAGA|nr:hypothetical protein DPX16_17770 [Anabarilius grahami]